MDSFVSGAAMNKPRAAPRADETDCGMTAEGANRMPPISEPGPQPTSVCAPTFEPWPEPSAGSRISNQLVSTSLEGGRETKRERKKSFNFARTLLVRTFSHHPPESASPPARCCITPCITPRSAVFPTVVTSRLLSTRWAIKVKKASWIDAVTVGYARANFVANHCTRG